MRIDIVTGLPAIVRGPLEQSIINRAVDGGLVEIHVHDLRGFATDRHRQIDDYPYGGGAGMVLKPEPLFAALRSILRRDSSSAVAEGQAVADVDMDGGSTEVVYLTPDGEVLDQSLANALSLRDHLVLIAGHYKGIDQRVRDRFVTREVSIGDYVLSGGELPALVLVDAVVRLLPGVLGDASSALTDSFQDGLLDAPVYTRPAVFEGMAVPEVLLSGNHEEIDRWRDRQRIEKTKKRRPDLYEGSQ
ncbi:MAG: tRNA (guanosine(37)-N1)-methyltransferase TrmD [Rhodothermales bacterium]|nr:tRNA (guanosine(37)-N1)-methyltransferase TrmD [Rhodothermales bacterium]